MILDKLLEKKDVLAYVQARTLDLAIQLTKITNLPERQREPTAQRLRGRIAELDHLRIVIASGRLKNQSKHHWKNVRREQENGSETGEEG